MSLKNEMFESKSCPEIWPSLMRLGATGAIFLFHFLGLTGHNRYHLDFYAIMAFCFLSGYLGSGIRGDRMAWLEKRYLGIMIPYWLVIIPVLFATIILNYKTVTYLKVFSAIAGLNLFVKDPVYVISWYVTFVLLLYGYAFFESFLQPKLKIIAMIVGLVFFSICLNKPLYFIAFIAGLRMAAFPGATGGGRGSFFPKSSMVLFTIQKYCYSFFLIHGGLLLFFVHYTTMSPVFVFLMAFVLTSISSIVLFHFSQFIQGLVLNVKRIAVLKFEL